MSAEKLFEFAKQKKYWAYFAAAILVTIISILSGPKTYPVGEYTHYNNYVIFKTSFKHLVDGVNLYSAYPIEYLDLYKYSPSFALFMGLFYYLPDSLGLSLWQLLNVVVFCYGIHVLKTINEKQKLILIAVCFFETMVSLQNHQSNLLLYGLLLVFFEEYRQGNKTKALNVLTLSVFIKIFTIVLLPLILFDKKIELKPLFKSALFAIAIAVAPIVITGWDGLIQQYSNWNILLRDDYTGSLGHSLHGILIDTFHVPVSKFAINLFGAVVLSFVFVTNFFSKSTYREINFFSFVSLWILVFNHKAESPTFIVAETGAILWLLIRNLKHTYVYIALFIVFTSLITTDLFPPSIRKNYFEPIHLKAFASAILLLAIACFSWFDLNRSRVKAAEL